MEFLMKWQEIKQDDNEEEYIVTLNHKVAKLIGQPMKFVAVDENGEEVLDEIEKDAIVCDGCNEVNPEYVLMDEEMLYRTICEKCRQKYWKKYKVVRGDEMEV